MNLISSNEIPNIWAHDGVVNPVCSDDAYNKLKPTIGKSSHIQYNIVRIETTETLHLNPKPFFFIFSIPYTKRIIKKYQWLNDGHDIPETVHPFHWGNNNRKKTVFNEK